jgi:hypothetical protein
MLQLAADLLVVAHLAFICFVVLGGLLALKWRRVAFVHIPAAVWGALTEFQGWLCPLTPLEHYFRTAAGEAGYAGSFIEHYLLPVIYPAGLTRDLQLQLGIFVVVINAAIYGWLLARHARARKTQ